MSERATCRFSCQNCNTELEQEGFVAIDASEAENLEMLLTGRINVEACPNCGASNLLPIPLFYHDGVKQLLVAYVPGAGQMGEEDLSEAIRIPYELVVTDVARQLGIDFPEPDPAAFPRGEENLHSPFAALTQEQAAEILPEYLLRPTIVDGMEVVIAMVQAIQEGMETQEVLDDMGRLQLINAVIGAPDAITRRKVLHRHEPYLDDELYNVIDTLREQMQQEGQLEILERMNFVRGEVERYRAAKETRLKKETSRSKRKAAPKDEPTTQN